MCHFVFSNDCASEQKLKKMLDIDFGDELFAVGNKCLYLIYPKQLLRKSSILTI